LGGWLVGLEAEQVSRSALGRIDPVCYTFYMNTTFINPFTDFGFKKIFGEEASKPHLIDFLNAPLPDEAKDADLSFKNLEQLPRSEDDRKAVYDIYCRGKNGEYFIVELQKVKQINFKDRTIFYSTFPIQARIARQVLSYEQEDQAQKGDWDYRLAPVYCVGVLGFTFDDTKANRTEVVHTVELKDQNNEVFYKKLTFIYLEMPNFDKPLEQLESRLDKWLYFIKNLEDLQSIPELFRTEEAFLSAFETAKFANLEPSERDVYEYSLKTLRDNFSAFKSAREEGLAEGEIIGEARGREAGILEEKARATQKLFTIARNLKTAGLTNEQIQAATGLTDSDLEKL
jgi:predicted transposase/invertase (TIGR01784 family)